MRRIVNLLPWKRRAAERELDRELRYHLERRIEDFRRSGLDDGDARRQARLDLGGLARVQEEVREAWTWRWLDVARQDAGFAVRSLSRRPRLYVACAAILGLAIGLTTAMFTLVDSLILRPVPFEAPDQLATIYVGPPGGGFNAASNVFHAWRSSPGLAGIEGVSTDSVVVGTRQGPVIRAMARVTPGIFGMLGGVRPVVGRLFDATEGQAGTGDRVLLSEDLWRSMFGSDAALLGQTIALGDESVIVVGILPAEFRFPAWNTAVWRAESFEQPDERPTAYVRFGGDVPRADTLVAATRVARETNAAYASLEAQARPLVTGPGRYYERALPLLSGGVVLLFFVLSANVSGLLLTGFASRGREFATRSALGASRTRIVRQALWEAAFIGAGGILAGTGLAGALVLISRDVLPEAALLQSLNPPSIDPRSLVAASIAGLAAILVAGLLPALVGTRSDASRTLERAGRGMTETGRARFARRALLASQIALSCTLLLGATLLVRSFVNLVNEDRGLDTSDILVVRVEFPPASFGSPEASALAADVLAREARSIPGIRLTSWSYGTPPGGAVTFSGQWTPDRPGAEAVGMTTYMFDVAPDFFALYGVRILRGRAFEASGDRSRVLVSERFARALWGDLDPVGRTFTFNQGRLEVIGLVQDIYYPSLDRTRDAPQWYTEFGGPLTVAMLSLGCQGPCPSPAVVTQRLTRAHPGVEIVGVSALEDYYSRELTRPRAAAALAFAFAWTALVAAAAGLFGLLLHAVTTRRRELGIRIALGASAADITRLVIREGLILVLTGISIGVLSAFALSRVLTALLFEVTMADPANWVIVAGVLSLAVVAAAWHPTRSAGRTAPAALLREE